MLGQGPQPLPVKSTSRFLAVYFLLCVLATQSFLSSIFTTKSRQDDKSHSQDCLPHLWASSSFSPVSAQMSARSVVSGSYHSRHLVSFMKLYDTRYRINNNNILSDGSCVTAAMMNHSGSWANRRVNKETICCVAPKNKSRNTEIHQELKYFVYKATVIIGVFKCVSFFFTASMCMLAYLPPVLTATWRQRSHLGLGREQVWTPGHSLWAEAMTQMCYVQETGFLLTLKG